MTRYELIVVGGGISGVWSAYHAAISGKKVALIDSSQMGSGGTGRSAGIHTTQLALKIDVKLSIRSLELYEELASKNDYEGLHKKLGFISIEESWMARESSKMLSELNIPYSLLSKDELRKIIPNVITRDSEVGVYTPYDIIINISAMYEAMRKILKELNVDIYEYSSIKGIKKIDKYILSAKCNNNLEFISDEFIFAAGPWNKGLMKQLNLWTPPTIIYVCQVLLFTKPKDMKILPTYFQDSHIYFRPDGDWRFIVGNGYAKIIDNPDYCPTRIEPEYVREIAEKLFDRITNPSEINIIGGWTGPCSTTPDGYPILGKVPGLENAWIIDGLNGYGLMRAPAMAELLVNSIVKDAWQILPKEFDPTRFNGLKDYEPKVLELHS